GRDLARGRLRQGDDLQLLPLQGGALLGRGRRGLCTGNGFRLGTLPRPGQGAAGGKPRRLLRVGRQQRPAPPPARARARGGERAARIREGAADGELRDDLPADLLALAIAGLTDLALVQLWASESTKPSLEQIPELVLSLLLGPGSPGSREGCTAGHAAF